MPNLRFIAATSIVRIHRKQRQLIEGLESRYFMSAAQPSFSNFASVSGLAGNGFGASPLTQGTSLEMTSAANNLARSVWWRRAVPVDTFTTHFSFVNNNASNSGDGLTFTLQNGATSAVGASGANLGYSSGTISANSVAIAFNLYNSGAFGSDFGDATGATLPATNTDMAPVDLHDGDTYNATVTYDGTNLSVTVTDASDSSKTFHTSQAINIPQILGTDTAIVGFTAATGNSVATQDITRWDYLGINGPTITNAATATPSSPARKTTSLSVLATDAAGESGLTYTWTTTRTPPGAKSPKFSINGTNAAKLTTVQFYKDGTYRFRATVTNARGQSTISDLAVVVRQIATEVEMSPHAKRLPSGKTQQFTAVVVDQFKHPMRTNPQIAFSIVSGPGSINATSGLYTASSATGHLIIKATDELDELSGIAGETVV